MLTGPHFSADQAGGAAASNVRDRLIETRNRISSAAMRYGREADSVRLIAVSKTQPADAIRALAALGQTDFAENYLQEALPKLAALADLTLTWHFIGQLQANKTRAVAEHFHWVHTLDRERIHPPPEQLGLDARVPKELNRMPAQNIPYAKENFRTPNYCGVQGYPEAHRPGAED